MSLLNTTTGSAEPAPRSAPAALRMPPAVSSVTSSVTLWLPIMSSTQVI
jgi:hypothetical protein